ncbi:MAG: hypothetical protein PWQ67_2541 [Clostridia bacterium]|jgi:hypothetical protein|nr:hypothetical protein [Clostridia bacterium]MDN5324087.1 hypothetical protein [Clostridia bacterium]
MSRKYKGKNRLDEILLPSQTSILIKVDVKEINYIQKIMECYENLAIVVPLDPKKGRLLIHTTNNLIEDVVDILKSLPVKIEIKR